MKAPRLRMKDGNEESCTSFHQSGVVVSEEDVGEMREVKAVALTMSLRARKPHIRHLHAVSILTCAQIDRSLMSTHGDGDSQSCDKVILREPIPCET